MDEGSRQRGHQSGDYALAFREMLVSVFVGDPGVSTADHVQVERALGDRAVAPCNLVFGAFDPDAVDVGVVKRVEDYSRVIVESVDCLYPSLLQAYYCNKRLSTRSRSGRVTDTDDRGKEWQ